MADWRLRGSYFEACNCEAICPCRCVGGRPGGPSSFGECFGALSWHIHDGHANGVDLSGLGAVISIRYFDRVRPSTRWEVVLYVDQGADDEQRAAIAAIFLGRAGGTVARLYGPAIGEVHAVRPARITLDHIAARKRQGWTRPAGRDGASLADVTAVPSYAVRVRSRRSWAHCPVAPGRTG